jgi:hypothetical protein
MSPIGVRPRVPITRPSLPGALQVLRVAFMARIDAKSTVRAPFVAWHVVWRRGEATRTVVPPTWTRVLAQ